MRGGSFELPPFAHRGTMLIEVILVLAITLAISGAVVTRSLFWGLLNNKRIKKRNALLYGSSPVCVKGDCSNIPVKFASYREIALWIR